MDKRIIHKNGITVAVIHDSKPIITDVQSALDLIATLDYIDDCGCVALNKDAIIEDFFILSTGLAGEILQKIVTYSKKIAIIGDFSRYTSKPLKAFIFECNRGNAVFFVPDEQTAIDMLTGK